MDIITEYLSKVAYKFPKGYPDLNDPQDRDLLESMIGISLTENDLDKEIEDKINHKQRLIDLIQKTEMSEEVAQQIEKMLANSTFKPSVMKYIESKGFTSDRFERGQDAVDYIFQKLADSEVDDFLQYAQTPLKFSSLPQTGNFQQEMKLPSSLLLDLININPGKDKGGSSIGKGEVFLGLMFDDIDNRAGGGDLNWKGKNFEIKGEGGRLGQQGGRGTSVPWQEFLIPDIVPEDKQEEFLSAKQGKLARNMTVGITMLAEFAKATNTETKLLQNVQKLLENIYYNKGFTKDYIKSFKDLTDANYLKKSLNKILFKSYAAKNNVDFFLFFDGDSNYRVIDMSNVDEEIDKGNINTTTGDPLGYFWDNPYPNMKFKR